METGQALRRGSGQALVEFALLLPLLMLLVLGAVDFGRAFYATSAASNAAFVGAYYASRNAGDGVTSNGVCTNPVASALRTEVTNELAQLPTSASNPSVSCTTGAESGSNSSYSFTPLPSCSTSGVAPTCAGGSCSSGVCTRSYRYVEVRVTYTFSMIGPYDVFVGNYAIGRTVRTRVRP